MTIPAIAGPLPQAEALTSVLEHERAARTSLRTLARMAYDGPDERGHARQVMLVVRPTRLRIEVLSPLGTVFVLTADDGALAAYARSEATVYRGRASRANLQRYARVNLGVSDAVDLLLGTPPPRVAHHDVVSFDAERAAIELWREIDGGAQVVWFNGALQPVATEERDDDGHVLWRARFSDFVAQQGDMPEHIELDVPNESRHVALDFQDVEVNPPLAESWFTLATPPGATEVRLDDTEVDS
ncbi:MAG TPA: hypothetical protein VL403_15095 [Candidatus Kryptonia bacterium]|nr:hypothetical protein [Candidatus Kryptonia bacterium]